MTKYSIKNICLGIGIGLIIASAANISFVPRSLSLEEIKREAQKHNLIVVDAKDLIDKQPQAEVPQQPIEQNTEQPAQPKAPVQQQSVVIEVKRGATSESVAKLLAANRLIDSEKVFSDRIYELNKATKLHIGSFEIPSGATVDEIINILTTLPR